MPDFLEQVCLEMMAEKMGALLVMAKGLGLGVVLRHLVELHCDSHHLVFLLNTSKEEEELLLHELTLRGVTRLPVVVNNECEAQERTELYLTGGVLIITGRPPHLLVVEWWSGGVPFAVHCVGMNEGAVLCSTPSTNGHPKTAAPHLSRMVYVSDSRISIPAVYCSIRCCILLCACCKQPAS